MVRLIINDSFFVIFTENTKHYMMLTDNNSFKVKIHNINNIIIF